MSILHRKLLHILTTTSTTRLTYINNTPVLSNSKSVCYANQGGGTGKGTSVDSMRQTWTQQFRECDIPDPESSADLIIAHVLGKKMIHEVAPNVRINKDIRKRIDELCIQRLDRKPVQYIIGEWDFLDITLKMRPPVLIPRPETEELCERIVKDLNETGHTTGPLRLLDIGCGTGAISLYLLSKLRQAICVALDKSSEACELTLENATILQLVDKLQVLHGDIAQDKILMTLYEKGGFDVIVSNPPYIPTVDMETLMPEVQRYESHEALHGGRDGLDIIRRILNVAGQLLKTEGTLWLETDVDHPFKIKDIVDAQSGFNLQFIEMFTDFSNRQRFCKLKRMKKR